MCKRQATLWFLAGAGLLLAACSPVRPLPTTLAGGATAAPASATPVPATPVPGTSMPVTPTADRWQEILQWSPYPYTTPLPPQASTPVDGIYVRLDPRTLDRPPCRRCPPYPPEGGIWKLALDGGVFRVYHPRTGWRTLGSYTVDGDRITLFNDPQCHLAVGHFTWQRDEEGLRFALLDDDCELGTRAKNFTAQIWESCQPPNHEAAITSHWKTPEGCDPPG